MFINLHVFIYICIDTPIVIYMILWLYIYIYVYTYIYTHTYVGILKLYCFLNVTLILFNSVFITWKQNFLLPI